MREHCNETHGVRGEVIIITVPTIIFRYLFDAIVTSYSERLILFCRIEVSGIHDWGFLDITHRQQRSTAVPLPDNPQNGGGYDRRVVCFYDPRFVLVHANRSIVAIRGCPMRERPTQGYGKTTIRRVAGVDSQEDCLDDRPPLIRRVF